MKVSNQEYDIVMLALSRWDNMYSSSAYCLAKEFARHNRVFYIDHPFSIKDFFSKYKTDSIQTRKTALLFGKGSYRKLHGLPANFTAVTPRLTLPINWLNQGMLYDSLSRVNDDILYATLRKLIKDFNIRNYIFINSFDPYFMREIPKDIKPKFHIYQTVDDITQESYIARHGARLENDAVSKADITLATSRELTRLKSEFSDKVYLLPNAADISIFRRAFTDTLDRPKELQGITQKVITYTGNIGLRMDYELLKKIATKHSDKILLMVGPTGNNDYKKWELDKIPNIIFTGRKDITELPAYLQHSDVAIIPFECSVLTKSIYPLKINEYLASGKPVVSSAFSEDISSFADVTYLAQNHDEFLSHIDTAIQEHTTEKARQRLAVAESNTWSARVDQFWDIIEEASALPRNKELSYS